MLRATLVYHLFRSILLFENILPNERNHQKPFAFNPLYRENIKRSKNSNKLFECNKIYYFFTKKNKKNSRRKSQNSHATAIVLRRISFTKSRRYTKRVWSVNCVDVNVFKSKSNKIVQKKLLPKITYIKKCIESRVAHTKLVVFFLPNNYW